MTFSWTRTSLVALFVSLTFAACGVKSQPKPPEDVRPEAITDLRAEQAVDGVKLSWSRPERYSGSGGRMRDLGSFVVLRAEGDGQLQRVAELLVTDRERFQVQKIFTYVDSGAELGRSYRYEVIAMTTDGYRSDPSNDISLVRATPAPAPNPETFVVPTPTIPR